MVTLSGPAFEPATTADWESLHRKDGGHYNTFTVPRGGDGMAALRRAFPDATADDMNFVLFSTSGIHGSYRTIEDVEQASATERRDGCDEVTFLFVQPRLCTIRYGNCRPRNPDDYAFLKKLRASSWAAVSTIGAEE